MQAIKLWYYGIVFRIMLFGLAFMLKIKARKSEKFQEHLKSKDLVMVIKTLDGKGRWFRIENGQVSSGAGETASPGFTMIWQDALKAVKAMQKGDQLTMMKAMNDGVLKMEGDPMLVMWFQNTMAKLRKS